MLRSDYTGQTCSIARSLELVGERWTLLIIRDAFLGLRRFEQIQESLGIATNVLTTRLRLLRDEGMLDRVPDPERPGRPKYVLTDKGRDFYPVLAAMAAWGDRHVYGGAGGPVCFTHKACGARFSPRLTCEACGEAVTPADLARMEGAGQTTVAEALTGRQPH